MTMKTKAPSTAKLNIVENSVIYNEDQCTALDRQFVERKFDLYKPFTEAK